MYCLSTESALLRTKRRKYNVGKCNLIITTQEGAKFKIELTGEPPRVYYKSWLGIVYKVIFVPTTLANAIAEFAIKELYKEGYLIYNNVVVDRNNVASIKIEDFEDLEGEEKIIQL
jgi:hypothetical protein